MVTTKPLHTLRIAIIGSGFLAETRARCWRRVPGVEIAAVASRKREAASSFAERHAIEIASDDAPGLIASGAIDAVDLCVPNALHRPFGEAAAAAGKHIICTKPLTAYFGQDLPQTASEAEIAGQPRDAMERAAVDDARALVAASANAGVQLCYGENWLYAPAIRRAAELLVRADAPLVEMRGWEAHSGSHSAFARSWRHTGGGALLRLAAHPIGAMLHLKRHEGLRRRGAPIVPVAVTAEVADLSSVEGLDVATASTATGWGAVENWGCAILHFDDGARGIAYGSDNTLGGMQSRLELSTPNAHYQCQLSPNDGLRSYAPASDVLGDSNLIEKQSTTAGWQNVMPDEDYSSGHLAMCEAFAHGLQGGGSPVADGQLGLDVVRVVYAAYRSASEGRRVELSDRPAAT